MKAQILTEDQIPEALSIARGVFDYCLRARITDLEMIHIFLPKLRELERRGAAIKNCEARFIFFLLHSGAQRRL